jgi:hypothetical protein
MPVTRDVTLTKKELAIISGLLNLAGGLLAILGSTVSEIADLRDKIHQELEQARRVTTCPICAEPAGPYYEGVLLGDPDFCSQEHKDQWYDEKKRNKEDRCRDHKKAN